MPGRWVYAKRDPDLIQQLLSGGYFIEYVEGGIRYWDPNALTGEESQAVDAWNEYLGSLEGGGGTSSGGGSYGGSSGGGGGGGGGVSGVFKAYEHVASLYGRKITPGEADLLYKKDVDPTEFALRLERLRWLDENGHLLPQLEATLRAQDFPNPKIDPYKFIKGQAPQPYYKVWQEFAGRAAAIEAGFEIGGDGAMNIKRKTLRSLAAQLPGTQEFADLLPAFQQAASLALQLGPMARYRNYGLRKRALLDVGAGIADADTLAKIQRMVGEVEAFSQLRASTAFRPQGASLAGQGGG